MAARSVLAQAAQTASKLGIPPRKTWAEVSEGLNVPMRSNGVIASHDGYRTDEEKGATPSPLMAIFPYWADIDEDTIQKTLRFYLNLWPDYAGVPMLPPLYGVWAAWAGERALSLKLLEEGYGEYQHGRFQQTLEYRLDKFPGGTASGPFFANMAGFITGLVVGMPALNVNSDDPATWPARPVVLPEGWTAIECDRLWIRGTPMRLRARHGAQRAELSPAGQFK